MISHPAITGFRLDHNGVTDHLELPRMLHVRYDGFLDAMAAEDLLPTEFSNVLSAIRDGAVMPVLDDADVASPAPVAEPERAREIALLLAMLMGLRQTGGDPELEFRVHARILHLVETADGSRAVVRPPEVAPRAPTAMSLAYH